MPESRARRRPRIMLVGTGGTIASSGSNAVDFHNYGVSSGIDEILAAVPEVASLADFESVQPINVDSFRIGNADLLRIAGSITEALSRSDIDAVVVTHGTDTLEETAYFLHLVLRTTKPVVVVGAMRPATAISADGPLNLYNAVLVATSQASQGQGVLVVANGHVFCARDAVKGDASSVDAIRGAKYGILAEICGDRVEFQHRSIRRHTANSEFDVGRIEAMPRVDIMFDHQDAGAHLYEASIRAGSKAIVVAGMGNGSLSPNARRGAELAYDAGVPVIRSTRTGQGIVASLRSDAEFQIVAAGSLPPSKARVLACVAIAHGIPGDQLQTLFDIY